MRAAGFEEVQIVSRHKDLYQDVPDPSSALEFGTQGVTFTAKKPLVNNLQVTAAPAGHDQRPYTAICQTPARR